jgi:hypothetical protein
LSPVVKIAKNKRISCNPNKVDGLAYMLRYLRAVSLQCLKKSTSLFKSQFDLLIIPRPARRARRCLGAPEAGNQTVREGSARWLGVGTELLHSRSQKGYSVASPQTDWIALTAEWATDIRGAKVLAWSYDRKYQIIIDISARI